jgi:hypothetical protein
MSNAVDKSGALHESARHKHHYGISLQILKADTLLKRDLRGSAPKEKGLTDLTAHKIPADKFCLPPMIDAFGGMVVSWLIGTRPNAELTKTILDAAHGAFGTVAATIVGQAGYR